MSDVMMMACPGCGRMVNVADPNNQHICKPITQEMTSLVQIKASLTTLTVSVAALNANHKCLKERLDAIAESQGKLLAALNEIGARTGDTLAMVNTIDFAVRKELNELALAVHAIPTVSGMAESLHMLNAALDGRLKGLGDGLGSECGEIRGMISQVFQETLLIRGGVKLGKRPAKPKRKRTK